MGADRTHSSAVLPFPVPLLFFPPSATDTTTGQHARRSRSIAAVLYAGGEHGREARATTAATSLRAWRLQQRAVGADRHCSDIALVSYTSSSPVYMGYLEKLMANAATLHGQQHDEIPDDLRTRHAPGVSHLVGLVLGAEPSRLIFSRKAAPG